MLRFLKRLFPTVVFICAVIANCQNAGLSPELQKRIEHQVRAYAEAPPEATITLLARHASEFPGYDVLRNRSRITINEFLLSMASVFSK